MSLNCKQLIKSQEIYQKLETLWYTFCVRTLFGAFVFDFLVHAILKEAKCEPLIRCLKRCLIRCAPLKTVYICNEKPEVNLKDDSFILKLFNPKTTERQKWNIINDTKNSKKSANKITLLKSSFGEAIINNFKTAIFLNYKFSRLGCFFEEKNNKN